MGSSPDDERLRWLSEIATKGNPSLIWPADALDIIDMIHRVRNEKYYEIRRIHKKLKALARSLK